MKLSVTPKYHKASQDKATQNEVDVLLKENAQLRRTIESMVEQIKINIQQLQAQQVQQASQIRELQQGQQEQLQQQPHQVLEEQQAEPMNEDVGTNGKKQQHAAGASEPLPKRRAIESLKERKLVDRVDKLENTVASLAQSFNSFKKEIREDFVETVRQSVETIIQQKVTPALQQNISTTVHQYVPPEVQQHMAAAVQQIRVDLGLIPAAVPQIRDEVHLNMSPWTGTPQAQ
ncbi:hypothetical protein HPB48_017253 [Haemaphysalis longicornis]|uniref:Uncharacterized protein n=1 Tax=Haemaphysalis longicornis TaxID=44386 RepID=A0A9J6F9R3_HAELO|nr:hypothetical protein HPB48_017253 [Haemaphysalis longicornis]